MSGETMMSRNRFAFLAISLLMPTAIASIQAPARADLPPAPSQVIHSSVVQSVAPNVNNASDEIGPKQDDPVGPPPKAFNSSSVMLNPQPLPPGAPVRTVGGRPVQFSR